MDFTGLISDISAVDLTGIGTAVLGVSVAILAFRMARRMIGG